MDNGTSPPSEPTPSWNRDWVQGEHGGETRVTAAALVDVVNPGRGTEGKLSVGGSREYPCLEGVLERLTGLSPGTLLLTGATRGPDAAAREAARRLGLELHVYVPRFDAFPTAEAAYFARNAAIIRDADRLECFWDGVSTGTAQAIAHARGLGKEARVRFPAAGATVPRMGNSK